MFTSGSILSISFVGLAQLNTNPRRIGKERGNESLSISE
jgi:hypothetical protein